MQNDIRVGLQTNAQNSGALVAARATRSGEAAVSDAHARYQEAVLQGSVYTGGNVAAQAVTLGVAAATGLILTNPVASGKNLVVLEAQAWIAAAITAVANVAIFANTNPAAAAVAQTTPIAPKNALLGGPAGVGLLASSATLPAAPTLIRPLFGWHWVTAGTPAAQLGVKDEVAGALVLAPGTAISIQGVTVAHSILASLTWEEVPV